MDTSIVEKARQWLDPMYDEQTRTEILRLMKEDPVLLEDSFYRNLEFGTGGLRGIMGVGTNRMNRYTVGMVTQGLANYVKKTYPAPYKAAIAFDCRNHSRAFANITARVLAANDFTVYLFEELRPTPELSFAVRKLECHIGVMITASHNPKEYNGYKVYGNDGAQVVAPHDALIIEQVRQVTSPDMVRFTGGGGQVVKLGKEMDHAYLDAILSLVNLSPVEITKFKDIKMVYTPLHGTSVHLIPMAMERMGFTNLIRVPEQEVVDGNFPTVVTPNPEEPEALKLAIERANQTDARLVMATDPDSDRIGVAVRDQDGQMVLLNGNQVAVLLTYYLLEKWNQAGRLEGKEYVVKTIVTTDLIQVLAEHYKVACYNVLTGFKYIAEVIRKNERKKVFICGGEESYGFNVGEFVRDKDAVISSVLVAEVACWAAARGKTLYDLLKEVYFRFGFFKERMVSRTLKGKDGMEQIKSIMKSLRENPPQQLLDSPVVLIHDYKKSQTVDMVSDLRYRISLPQSDVIQFICADNTIVTVRPSGTEPKIKYYYGVRSKLVSEAAFPETKRLVDEKLAALHAVFQK
ncbi:MAG TPA: phospho-sugar mutase [Bacteroidales bacterium]|nr:MAG: Phosphoglucomutase [Bacteroidetes bacterium ADurb.Bin139]HOG25893.1 phospho-sugar mutase [Bacteroidales bacterium]HOR10877.1 phospho-sugar mutase [Bacteroidales bacterium]HPB77872.1 phospho-sugar mutase [Bacteroidales bacterium]HPK38432.1 phospho-sugar mutase [Bacteroidales bacterium]